MTTKLNYDAASDDSDGESPAGDRKHETKASLPTQTFPSRVPCGGSQSASSDDKPVNPHGGARGDANGVRERVRMPTDPNPNRGVRPSTPSSGEDDSDDDNVHPKKSGKYARSMLIGRDKHDKHDKHAPVQHDKHAPVHHDKHDKHAKTDHAGELIVEPGKTYNMAGMHINKIRSKGSTDEWKNSPARVISATIVNTNSSAVDVSGCRLDFVGCVIRSLWEADSESKDVNSLKNLATVRLSNCMARFDSCTISCGCGVPTESANLFDVTGDSMVDIVKCDLFVRYNNTQCQLSAMRIGRFKGVVTLHGNRIEYLVPGGNLVSTLLSNESRGRGLLNGNTVTLDAGDDKVRSSTFHHVHVDDTSVMKILSSCNTITTLPDLLGIPHWLNNVSLAKANNGSCVTSSHDLVWGLDEKPGVTIISPTKKQSHNNVHVVTESGAIEPDDRLVCISAKVTRPITLTLPKIGRSTQTKEVSNDSKVSHVIRRSGMDTLNGKETYTVAPGTTATLLSSLTGNNWTVTV